MTFIIALLAVTGRIEEWEHFPHYGGGNCLFEMNGSLLAGTSGGVLFSSASQGDQYLAADSGWTYPGPLSYDRVSDLFLDDSGNLWVSLDGGGIDMFTTDLQKTHFNQIDGLPLDLGINQTLVDTVIYAATSQGLCIREFGYFETWDSYSTGGGLPSDNINCILSVDSGLMVGTTAGLTLLSTSAPPGDPGSWQLQGVEQSSILDLAARGDTVLAITGDKLFRKVPGQDWAEDLSFPGSNAACLSRGEGDLAVGCFNDCWILSEGEWTSRSEGLGGNVITGLAWYRGSLCAVLTNYYASNRASGLGMALLDQGGYWNRTFPPFGPVSNDLRACDILQDGTILVSSNRNGASAYTTAGDWVNLTGNLTSGSQCFAACRAANGALISSLGNGVDWLDWEQGQVLRTIHFTEEDGLPNNRVFHAAPGSDGTVWMAHRTFFETEEAGVSRLSWTPGDTLTASFDVVSGQQGLPSKEVNFVLPDGARYAWAATDEGLAYVDGDTRTVVSTWTSLSGLPSSLVNSLARGRSGQVYAGTASGLAVISDGSALPVDEVSIPVETMAFDALGSLWLATSSGLMRYFPATGNLESYTTFNSPLPDLTVYSMTVDSNEGYLWMATDHGMWKGTLESGLSGGGSDAKPYPNPFKPGDGEILGVSGIPDEPALFTVFDLTGAPVFSYSSTGRDDFAWDGVAEDGSDAASGVYFLMVEGGTFEAPLLKFTLVR